MDANFCLCQNSIQPQLLWNSSTANSPDKARVYRATIAPLDQPAAALTDVSDTPFLSACTAQPRLQALAEGAPKRCRHSLIAFVVMSNNEPCERLPMCLRSACRADGLSGAIRGLPVLDVRTIKNPSLKFTSETSSRAISLLRNPHDHNTSIKALSRNVDAAFTAAL